MSVIIRNLVPLTLTTADDRLQCAICRYLLNAPLQFPCGHRICTPCARKLREVNTLTFHCKKCEQKINFSDYVLDRAAAQEIDSIVIACPCCSWTGRYCHLRRHINEGCKDAFIKSKLDDHEQNYHYQRTFSSSQQNQQNVTKHGLLTKKSAFQQCLFAFIGCQFVGNDLELAKHMEKDMSSHLEYVCSFLSSQANEHASMVKSYDAMQEKVTRGEKLQLFGERVNSEVQATEMQGTLVNTSQIPSNGIEKFLSTIQASITEINHIYEEVSLTLQTLQATSYDGKYIWKIPDITRRRRDALMGKTVSLYSAPFYTDRFGYRMCLRVYLDGDGSGKGRYISYFLTIMKGEYDALLEWPFQLTVTLTMINQKGNGNIVQSFKPNPNSASFHQPKADMNVASGCPKFAPLSVLDNQEFIVDNAAFFQCVVNNK